MVRSYFRHEPSQVFGLICSNTSTARSVFDAETLTAYVPALEDVIAWDTRKGDMIGLWHETGQSAAVTALARAPRTATSPTFAVGYEDGSIRIWDPSTGAAKLTLDGHSKAVTALAFSVDGTRLASGSQDTDIIIWDTVAESGLFRLRGHRDAITDLIFVQGPGATMIDPNSTGLTSLQSFVVSSSKDSFIKLWDLNIQHCLDTAVSAHGQVWTLALYDDAPSEGIARTLIVSGNSDSDIALWELDWGALDHRKSSARLLTPCGSVALPSGGGHRVNQVAFSHASTSTGPHPHYLCVLGSDKMVHVYRLKTLQEAERKVARRKKRAKELADRKGKVTSRHEGDDTSQPVSWQDRLELHTIIRPTGGKLRSVAFGLSTDASDKTGSDDVLLLCTLASNALEVHRISRHKATVDSNEGQEGQETSLLSALDLPGHRAEVRATAISPDDTLLASVCSSGLLKIWNIRTAQCVRTFGCGYGLCVAWLADNRHVLVGCKDGSLHSYDVPAAKAMDVVAAHDGPLWSIAVHPSASEFVTASADHNAKFWSIDLRSSDADGSRTSQLNPVLKRTLKMTDDILCARFSSDGKLLALSLLDCTVKIFFVDTLKFFLSLYGHKLPVLALDISADSKLCITVSADKNVKIWGLDFGDCHKSLFAHSDSVMACAFEQGDQGGGLMGGRQGASHHFWTAGKDGLVKHWDGDRFELIQTLKGHHGPIWTLAVDSQGSLLVSAGSDRSLRTWAKSEEPLFLEEEREKELEQLYISSSGRHHDQHAIGALADDPSTNSNSEAATDAAAVTKSSEASMAAGERLIEAIELADSDRAYQGVSAVQAPPRSPILIAAFEGSGEEPTAEKYVLKCLDRIPASELEDALLVLPFEKVISLFTYLELIAAQSWATSLVARVFSSLLKTHNSQLVTNRVMRVTLKGLRLHLRQALKRQRTTLGYNLAALEVVRLQRSASQNTNYLEPERDATGDLAQIAYQKKRKIALA